MCFQWMMLASNPVEISRSSVLQPAACTTRLWLCSCVSSASGNGRAHVAAGGATELGAVHVVEAHTAVVERRRDDGRGVWRQTQPVLL